MSSLYNLEEPNNMYNNALKNILEILLNLNQTLTEIIELHKNFLQHANEYFTNNTKNIPNSHNPQNSQSNKTSSNATSIPDIVDIQLQLIEEITQFLEARQFYINTIIEDIQSIKSGYLETYKNNLSNMKTNNHNSAYISNHTSSNKSNTTTSNQSLDLTLYEIIHNLYISSNMTEINTIHNEIIDKIKTFFELDKKIYDFFQERKMLISEEIKKIKRNSLLLKGYLQPNIIDSAFIDKKN